MWNRQQDAWKPVTACEKPFPAVPTLQCLIEELETITDWQGLGIRLGIPEHKLRETEIDNRGKVPEHQRDMLSCWLKSTTKPSWEAMTAALGKMKEWKVAAELKLKYRDITSHVGKKWLYSYRKIKLTHGCIYVPKKASVYSRKQWWGSCCYWISSHLDSWLKVSSN